MSAIVIGGGITGLTLGWTLRRAGRGVRVLERAQRPGGAIHTIRRAGYLVEAGPNTMQVTSAAQESLLRGLGLTIQRSEPAAKNRYLLRGGQFHAAPLGPVSFLQTELFSTKAKWRLLGDLVARQPSHLAEESLACFVERHFGPEVLDYAVNPLVSGIYAGDPKKLSAQYSFPRLAEAEAAAGSVVRGMLKLRQQRVGPRFKPYSASFAEGMRALPDALARSLGEALVCGAVIESIVREDGRWTVAWQTADGTARAESADELWLAVPAFALADLPLPEAVHADLAPLAAIDYPPVASVALGYDRRQIAHALDGFGGLIPEVERRQALGILFSSSLFAGRAPEGKALLTVFVGGSRQPELARQSPEDIQALAETEVRELLEADGAAEFAEVTVWPRAIPQYNVGYGEFLAGMERAEANHPGLHVRGNHRGGIAVGQCLVNAAESVEPLG